MNLPAPRPTTVAATAGDLIRCARDARQRRELADRDMLAVASEWAASHEVEGPSRRETSGTPRGFGDAVDGVLDDRTLAPTERSEPDELDRCFARYDAACRGQRAEPMEKSPQPSPPGLAMSEVRAESDEVETVDQRRGWRGLPELTWDCAAPFAAALGQSTRAGWLLLRQAMVLEHRLPRTYRAWRSSQLDTRPAKIVADAVAGQADGVCAWVDIRVAQRLARQQGIGPVVAERLVQQAMTELHVEELELRRQEELHARFARVAMGPRGIAGPDSLGLAEFVIRGDWPDVKAFDDTVAALAEALRQGDGPESSDTLDVRRSTAVGILADPARALTLLAPTAPHETPEPVTRRQQKLLLAYHLAAGAVTGVDQHNLTWLDSTMREWAGRPDMAVAVRPVIHCGGCADCDGYCDERHAHSGYVPTDLDRERVILRNPHCVFPHCSMPAPRADCDHIVPFDAVQPGSGPTCPKCNLAPLCRHHHRLKTHAGWRYRQVEPGTFTWSEPHGQRFPVARHGTRDLTDLPDPPDTTPLISASCRA